ncbi:accessory gene regulator B family protein [Roseburia inulinivorans]|uniref:accessory gene regulator B family protein n=1 Tax=Roseburia inulinivorans TaxID=360807 RepID=UPI002092290E|nr:accessory gene regulator B family protein [Roseburia inulinivorans]
MIEKIADDLIGQMTEARLIDKEMEARYVYVFICWIEKFITVGSIIVISLMFHKLLPTIFFLVFFLELRKRTGSIIVISLMFHKLLPTIFFLVFFLELRKRTGGYHLDKFYRCYLASIVSYLVIVIISEKLSEHPQWFLI